MIGYYHLPIKKGTISQQEQLHIADESELKDALYSKTIEKVKYLSFKNANIMVRNCHFRQHQKMANKSNANCASCSHISQSKTEATPPFKFLFIKTGPLAFWN